MGAAAFDVFVLGEVVVCCGFAGSPRAEASIFPPGLRGRTSVSVSSGASVIEGEGAQSASISLVRAFRPCGTVGAGVAAFGAAGDASFEGAGSAEGTFGACGMTGSSASEADAL